MVGDSIVAKIPASDNASDSQLRYAPGRDARWLLLRPWISIPRLFQIIWALTGLVVSLLLRGRSKDPEVQRKLAQTLLRTLTNLGPCFIKVGQALSTRPDLIRRDWLDELTRLQDDLPSFSHSIALQTIEEELGAPVDQLFEEFPDAPVAAASLGQVYRARLHGEHWVAVKVQRPNLAFILRRDMVLIRTLGVLGAPFLPLNLGFGLGEIIDEFGRSLFEEIDYFCEADNAERFAALFADNPAVTIPKVERLLSARRVLTTSWIHGTKLRNRQELTSQRLDPASLIRTGVISGLQQLLEYGYFHADPHPGNLFALSGRTGELGHVAYVDFGMMDSISDYDRLTLTGAVVHLINKDFSALAQDFQRLGFLAPNADLDAIIPPLKEVLGGSLGDSVGTFNFKAITDRFSELMYDYPFRVPARFALIIRAVVSQELGRTPSVTELASFVELPEEEVKDLMCRARQPVSLEMKVGDGDDTELLELLAGDGELPSEQVEGECLKGDLRDLLGQLPELQGRVLRMRYGMDGEEPMSLTGIGRIIGISRDRVRNLERDGLAGLRRLSDQVEAYVAC